MQSGDRTSLVPAMEPRRCFGLFDKQESLTASARYEELSTNQMQLTAPLQAIERRR